MQWFTNFVFVKDDNTVFIIPKVVEVEYFKVLPGRFDKEPNSKKNYKIKPIFTIIPMHKIDTLD